MSRALLCAAAVMVVAVGVLSGCSKGSDSVGPGVSIPQSDRVTDAAAIALTEEEAERIREACGDATDLPEPGSPCWDAIEEVEPPAGDEPADCSVEICLEVEPSTDVPDTTILYMRDPRPGSPICQGSRVCDGFEVPSPLAARVADTDSSATTAPETTASEPTESTETEPSDPVEPTDEPTEIPPST
jgi:hypothetical protein